MESVEISCPLLCPLLQVRKNSNNNNNNNNNKTTKTNKLVAIIVIYQTERQYVIYHL